MSDLDRAALRKQLIAARRALPDREERIRRLERALDAWLGRDATITQIGAYWPIRGEPDLLPVLGAWVAADPVRRVGLPVIDPATSHLRFHAWRPGCAMRADAFGIPTPDGAERIDPHVLLVPCVGFGPGGIRLGYGGGFYDRTLAALPRPRTVGIAFAGAFVAGLAGAAHDIPLDHILTDEGFAAGG